MPSFFPRLSRHKKPYRPTEDENLEVTRDYRTRLRALYGILVLCLLIFAVVLYNAQIVNGADYYATSASRIAQEEPVEASRGVITDRNGKVLVSNRQVYTLTFDEDLLSADDDINQAILSLLQLLEQYNITWTDTFPITAQPPFAYTLSTDSSTPWVTRTGSSPSGAGSWAQVKFAKP